LYVSANEITTIDNTSWIFIHLYVVQGWKQILLLVCVEKVGMQGIAKNIFHLMLIATVTFGGLSVKDLGEKLISMGCDGDSVNTLLPSQHVVVQFKGFYI